jgi:hypothetical protein
MDSAATGNTAESGTALPMSGGAVPTILAQHRMRRALPRVIKQVTGRHSTESSNAELAVVFVFQERADPAGRSWAAVAAAGGFTLAISNKKTWSEALSITRCHMECAGVLNAEASVWKREECI